MWLPYISEGKKTETICASFEKIKVSYTNAYLVPSLVDSFPETKEKG